MPQVLRDLQDLHVFLLRPYKHLLDFSYCALLFGAIALFTVNLVSFVLHMLQYISNIFERGCKAISAETAKLPEIASHPRSNTL